MIDSIQNNIVNKNLNKKEDEKPSLDSTAPTIETECMPTGGSKSTNMLKLLQQHDFLDNELLLNSNLNTKDLMEKDWIKVPEILMENDIKRFNLFLQNESPLFSRNFKADKSPITPQNLGIKFSVGEFLSFFYSMEQSNQKSTTKKKDDTAEKNGMRGNLVGSAFDYFFHKITRHIFDNILLGDKKMGDTLPKSFWGQLEEQIKQEPNDFDFRIYLNELDCLNPEKILSLCDQFFADKFRKAEENNRKKYQGISESSMISKDWANDLLEKFGYKKIDPKKFKFWESFVEKMCYGQRVSPDSNGIGLVQIRHENRIFEISFISWANRQVLSLQRAFMYDLSDGKFKFPNNIGNELGFSPIQALIDKRLLIHRCIQKNETIIDLGQPKDWMMMISHITKGRPCAGEEMVETSYKAALKSIASNKTKNISTSDFFLSLIEKIAKGHRNFPYLALAFNVMVSLPDHVDKKTKIDLFRKIVNNLSLENLNEDNKLILELVKKYSYDEVSAYFQLLGYISIIATEGKCPRFTTILWNSKEMLQVELNDQEFFLLPLDIENSLKLLIEKPSILSFNEKLIVTFMNYYASFKPALTCESLVKNHENLLGKLMSQCAKAPLLKRALHALLTSFDIPNLGSVEDDLIIFPKIDHHKTYWTFLKPILEKHPYKFDENSIRNMTDFIRGDDFGSRWRKWILALNEYPTMKITVQKSLNEFLNDTTVTKKKKFFNNLFNSWKKQNYWDFLYSYLQDNSVKQCCSSSPDELGDLWLATYEQMKDPKKRLVIAQNIGDLYSQKEAMNHKKMTEKKELLAEIFFCLLSNNVSKHEEKKEDFEKSLLIAQYFFVHVPEFWVDLLANKNISFDERKKLWLNVKDEAMSKDQGSAFIEVGFTLLNECPKELSQIFSNIFSILNSKLEETIHTESEISEFKRRLKLNLKRDNYGKTNIHQAPISDLEKYGFLLQNLEISLQENGQGCFNEMISICENHLERCHSDENFIKLIVKNFSSLKASQIYNLFSAYPEILLEFIQENETIKLVLSKLTDVNETQECREDLLFLFLDKDSRLFEDAALWIDLFISRIDKISIKKGSKKYQNKIVDHLFSTIDGLLIKKNSKVWNVITSFNVLQKICYPETMLNKLMEELNSSKTTLDKEVLYQLLLILSRSGDCSSKIAIEEICTYLFVEDQIEDLHKKSILIDLFLRYHPNLLDDRNSPLIQQWASDIQSTDQWSLVDPWIEKIKHRERWEDYFVDYCQRRYTSNIDLFVKELGSVRSDLCLSLITTALKKEEMTSKKFFEWTQILNKHKIKDIKIWHLLLSYGLSSTDKLVFDKSCSLIDQNKLLIELLKGSFNFSIMKNLVQHVYSSPYNKFIEELIFSDGYKMKLNSRDLISIYKSWLESKQKESDKNKPLDLSYIQIITLFNKIKPSIEEADEFDFLILKHFSIDSKRDKNSKLFPMSITTVKNLINRERTVDDEETTKNIVEYCFNAIECWVALLESNGGQIPQSVLKNIDSILDVAKHLNLKAVRSIENKVLGNQLFILYMIISLKFKDELFLREIKFLFLMEANSIGSEIKESVRLAISEHLVTNATRKEDYKVSNIKILSAYSKFLFELTKGSFLSDKDIMHMQSSFFEYIFVKTFNYQEEKKSNAYFINVLSPVWKECALDFFKTLSSRAHDEKILIVNTIESIIDNAFCSSNEQWIYEEFFTLIEKGCVEKKHMIPFTCYFIQRFEKNLESRKPEMVKKILKDQISLIKFVISSKENLDEYDKKIILVNLNSTFHVMLNAKQLSFLNSYWDCFKDVPFKKFGIKASQITLLDSFEKNKQIFLEEFIEQFSLEFVRHYLDVFKILYVRFKLEKKESVKKTKNIGIFNASFFEMIKNNSIIYVKNTKNTCENKLSLIEQVFVLIEKLFNSIDKEDRPLEVVTFWCQAQFELAKELCSFLSLHKDDFTESERNLLIYIIKFIEKLDKKFVKDKDLISNLKKL